MKDFRVLASIASQPRPQPPLHLLRWRVEWQNYFDDLACWRAMKADCITFGVKEDETKP